MVFDHMHAEFGDLLVAIGGPVQTNVANMNVFTWQATIMKDISSHEQEYEARANAKMAKMLLECDEYPKELVTMYLGEDKDAVPKPKGKGDDPMDGTKNEAADDDEEDDEAARIARIHKLREEEEELRKKNKMSKGPPIYDEADAIRAGASTGSKDPYGGRVQVKQNYVDVAKMTYQEMRTYNASWHGSKEKLGDFCDNFPYKELADDDKFYGLQANVWDLAVQIYIAEESKNMKKMPEGLTRAQSNEWKKACLASIVATIAHHDTVNAGPTPPAKGPKPTCGVWQGTKHPVGSPLEPRMWKVHPNATELRDHLAMRKDEYGWDASLMERICGLNTRNLNLMLNSFSMGDYETYVPSDAIKKGDGLHHFETKA